MSPAHSSFTPPPFARRLLLAVVAGGCIGITGHGFAQAPEPIPTIESRLLSEAEIGNLLQRVAPRLLISGRKRDPFGALQDPEAAEEVIPGITPDIPALATATPLADLVARINIGTIMPSEHRFLIGSRSIRRNQEFPVSDGRRTYRLRAEEINSRRIVFRNLDTNETATREFSGPPAGMSRGNGTNRVPGMSTPGPDTPITLDP